MKTFFVVTGIVKNKNKFLILKKSPDDYNYPDKWSFCSGFVKEFEAGEDTVIREIKEETGLDAKIIKTCGIVESIDDIKKKKWVVAVYLCEVNSQDVRLCHENVDFRWISPDEMDKYHFVPGLSKQKKLLESFSL